MGSTIPDFGKICTQLQITPVYKCYNTENHSSKFSHNNADQNKSINLNNKSKRTGFKNIKKSSKIYFISFSALQLQSKQTSMCCQNRFQLVSSAPVKLRTEISLIISVKPTQPAEVASLPEMQWLAMKFLSWS